ncbi:hypothetical protein [Rhodobacter maris]|uniref:Glycosyl transferase family 10 (Putative fucosyltransferase) n=1 Tax=Rhodobacter maris TaxID=446682 RepID=A0A285SG77_9RHOB|nr:hypothetical protein [Rhodobacter maris]SOC06907.1 hypothetical protein SAMN05877831_105176 [Rhodobacter maris]
MLKVYPFGDYSHRQPLAYAPIRTLCSDRITLTDKLEAADLVVLAHSKDLDRHGAALRARLGRGQRLVLLSEEPFWDSVWAADPLTRVQIHRTETGPLPFTFLNHATSRLYDFAEIPYFLLTDRRFFTRYATWFHRNAALSAADWAARWDAAERDIAFVAEYRNEAKFDICRGGGEILGLGSWRTRLALACNRGRVLRMGAGWNDLPRRQSLPDWHLEKFLDLDGRCRVLSAIENTHQRNYVSEKIFDSFALGAVPIYVADPAHLVHGLVSGGIINLWGLTPDEGAAALDAFHPDAAFREGYIATQAQMARLFGTAAALSREQRRLATALWDELVAVCEASLPAH